MKLLIVFTKEAVHCECSPHTSVIAAPYTVIKSTHTGLSTGAHNTMSAVLYQARGRTSAVVNCVLKVLSSHLEPAKTQSQ